MALDRQQLHRMLASVADTLEDELDCDGCLAGMAEFAEAELVGAEVPAALQRIQAHLLVCPECAEEFEVLIEVLRAAQ